MAGPTRTVVCDEASWPNSMFGDRLGHVDGVDVGGCEVPTVGTWVAAIVVLVAVVAVTAWITRHPDT